MQLNPIQFFYSLITVFFWTSCQEKKAEQAVARIGEEYIYFNDIEGITGESITKDDSLNIVRSYLDQMARQKLLYKQALKNINSEQQMQLNKLVEQYKSDLLVKIYYENLMKNKIDTIVTHRQMVAYYNENKENFKTHQSLIQMRYIQISKNHPNFESVVTKFKNFQKKDIPYWQNTQLQLISSALNDSIWIDMNQVYQKLPFLNPDNKSNFIVPQKLSIHEDSLEVYYLKINNVIEPNQITPFEILKPTIKEILLNQRQQQFIKQFEKDIIKDAIKNNTYEIY